MSDLELMIGSFDKVCTRRGMKVNASKSKVMVFGGEEEVKKRWRGCMFGASAALCCHSQPHHSL